MVEACAYMGNWRVMTVPATISANVTSPADEQN
jgi:hypothetical protein